MDSDYVFLCGVMWCRYGQQEAGKELLRATDSMDPDMRTLGLGDVGERCNALEGTGITGTNCSRTILGRRFVASVNPQVQPRYSRH